MGRDRAADPVRGVEHLADEPGERRRIDRAGHRPGPVRGSDEVRLGCLADAMAGRAQRRRGQGQDAALAVRAADQRAAERQLRIAELAQKRAGPAKTESDAEPAALLEGPEPPRS